MKYKKVQKYLIDLCKHNECTYNISYSKESFTITIYTKDKNMLFKSSNHYTNKRAITAAYNYMQEYDLRLY